MKEISIIVAMGKNRVIGIHQQLPWHLPIDLAHFKAITLHKTIVMGRKTFESIGHPLPHRENIIITSKSDYTVPGCKIAHSLENAIELASTNEIIFSGGSSLYAQALCIANTLYLTFVDIEIQGDTFFPEINPEDWQEIDREIYKANHENPYDCTFVTLKRR